MKYVGVITFHLFLIFVNCFAQDVGYDRDSLQRLTEYRQQHRKTLNGALCAAAFVQEGQTYTDCTTAKSPDGTIGREWCYVEYQSSRESGNYWNFCTEVINYDTVRAKAREIVELKERDMQSAAIEVRNQAARLQEILHRYTQVCVAGHDIVPGRIEKIKNAIKAGGHTTSKLQAVKSKISFLESTIASVKEDIKKDRIASSQDRKNCEAIRGYEDDPTADGLRGSYFNNAHFEGVPTAYKDDRMIDFVWDEISPVANLPIQHFSARWDGYVMAPETGKYTFAITADCGARVFLDDAAIIVDRMPTPFDEDAMTENAIHVLSPVKSTGVLKTNSMPQPLVGGRKYRIRVEYFHLSSLKWSSPYVATLKLSWKTDSIDEQVIPRDRFFKSNPKKSLKISGLPGKYFDMTLLEDGTRAFLNSKHHFISDVPLRFEGAKLFRTVSHPKYNQLHLTVSAPCMFYVAAPTAGKNPITPGDPAYNLRFTPGVDSLTVLTASSSENVAIDQTSMSIHGVKLNAGSVDLKVDPGTSFLMFFVPLRVSEGKCSGEISMVSRTGSKTFGDCTSSSYAGEEFNCKAGLNGINQDTMFGVWRTSGGYGVGQFLSVSFTEPVQLVAFKFKTRDKPETLPREITLYFSGTHEVEKINIVPGEHTYQLQIPRIATSVELVVTKMRDDTRLSDTGGSVAFLGMPCKEEKVNVSETAESEENIAISFRAGMVGFPPEGYKLDDGSPKGQHGKFFYGWDHNAKPVDAAACEDTVFLRNITAGGIQFPPTVETNVDCASGEIDCTPNSWSINMPHYGTYRVTVEVGSPCGPDQLNELSVNGIPFIGKETLRAGQYSKSVGVVSLLATPTVHLTSSSATTIQSIRIEKINNE